VGSLKPLKAEMAKTNKQKKQKNNPPKTKQNKTKNPNVAVFFLPQL